jgi:flagellar hook-associated protein 2
MTTTTSATSSTAGTTATTAPTTTSTSSLGQSILTSLNAGSGINTDSLITGLSAAQKSSLEDPITAKQAANTAQISSLASIAGDMSTFSTSLNTLIAGGSLFTQPTSSDSSVLTVSPVAGGSISGLSSQIEVTQLAQTQTIESSSFDPAIAFATGTLTLTTQSQPGGMAVTIDSNNNTMAGIAAAINAANAGVTATVLNDSDGTARLVVKGGATGSVQAFSLSGGTGTLAAFSYTAPASTDTSTSTASASGMGRDQAAQDAVIKLDGVIVKRSTNVFSDVIKGVKINLLAAKPGTIVSIGATQPTDAITQAVNDFVSAYNGLRAELATATAASTSSSAAGPLRGNATIRDMQRRLASISTTPLIASGSITTLAQLGVKTGQDGTLSVDGTMLATALANSPDDVERMFNPIQSSSAAGVSIASKIGAVATGTYSLTNLVPASGTASASGTIDGTAAVGSGPILTAATGSPADGLMFSLTSAAPGSATLTIDQGLGGVLQAITDAMTSSSGAITALQATLKTQASKLADALTAADAKVTVYHDRLVSQFATMNTRVSAIKATQSYLTQQTDLWTKSTS